MTRRLGVSKPENFNMDHLRENQKMPMLQTMPPFPTTRKKKAVHLYLQPTVTEKVRQRTPQNQNGTPSNPNYPPGSSVDCIKAT